MGDVRLTKLSPKNTSNQIPDKQPEQFGERIAQRLFHGRTVTENPQKLSNFEAARLAHTLNLSNIEILGVFFNFDKVIDKVNNLFSESIQQEKNKIYEAWYDQNVLQPINEQKEQIDKKVTEALQNDKLGPIAKMKLIETQKATLGSIHNFSMDRHVRAYEEAIDSAITKGHSVQKYPAKNNKTVMLQELNDYANLLNNELDRNTPVLGEKPTRMQMEAQIKANALLSEIKKVQDLDLEKSVGDNEVIRNDLNGFLHYMRNQTISIRQRNA